MVQGVFDLSTGALSSAHSSGNGFRLDPGSKSLGTWDVGKAVPLVFAGMSDYWILGSRASAPGTEHA